MGFAQSLMRFDAKLRPLLSQNLPAWAFVRAYSISRNPMLHFLSNERPPVDAPLFPVEFNGLTFRNDLGNAAGYDKNGDLLPLNYFMGAGFGVVGTNTLIYLALVCCRISPPASPVTNPIAWTPFLGNSISTTFLNESASALAKATTTCLVPL